LLLRFRISGSTPGLSSLVCSTMKIEALKFHGREDRMVWNVSIPPADAPITIMSRWVMRNAPGGWMPECQRASARCNRRQESGFGRQRRSNRAAVSHEFLRNEATPISQRLPLRPEFEAKV